MAEGKRSNKSKKNRKFGRSKIKCQRYAAEHRRVRNNPARKQRATERTPH